jgi:hypothetical protein
MFFVTALTLAAAAVSASPVERQTKTTVLPLKHVSNVTSVKNIVNRGQQRISAINGVQSAAVGPSPDVSSGSVTNEDVTYVAPVKVGSSTWQLIVDTGCKSILPSPLEMPC